MLEPFALGVVLERTHEQASEVRRGGVDDRSIAQLGQVEAFAFQRCD